jgi:hypothetical protein
MLDRVAERRRAVKLARHYRDQEGLAIAEIARRLGRAQATIKAYLYDPTGAKARAVKARYRGVCRGCGAPTAPRNGKGDAYAYCKRCHPGAIAPEWSRERVREAMRAWRARYGAAANRSHDYKPENGPRRLLSSICTGAGRRPSPTPSAAPERLSVSAVVVRTRACASPSVKGSAERRRCRCWQSSAQGARLAPRWVPAFLAEQQRGRLRVRAVGASTTPARAALDR